MTKRIAITIGTGLLLAAGGLLLAAGAAGAGTVSGKVLFKGTPPPARTVSVTTDSSVCGNAQQSEDLVVGPDKGIRFAVVRVIGAKVAPDAAKPPEIDQKGCKFSPHVVIVTKGGMLDILNSDGIAHNVHSHSSSNPEFNKAQPGFKKRISQKLEEPEKVRLTCDIHPWMGGWVVVADGEPVAVTDASGSFKLPNIPPGTYKVEVWQEKLGTQVKEITVKAGADTDVGFELSRN